MAQKLLLRLGLENKVLKPYHVFSTLVEDKSVIQNNLIALYSEY